MRTLTLAILSAVCVSAGIQGPSTPQTPADAIAGQPPSPVPVKVQFDPQTPSVGPFPNDFLRVPDETQKTGWRVNVPLSNCVTAPSDCAELSAINRLDGFNVQARISVSFAGPVDTSTLERGVYYLWLDANWLIGVNRVVWNPATLTMTAKPNEPLLPGTRYAVIVTDAVRSSFGLPAYADEGFTACLNQQVGGDYCTAMSQAAAQAAALGLHVVGGSVFTTASATGVMEAARDQVSQMLPSYQMDKLLAVSDIRSMTTHAQVRTSGEMFQDVAFPASPSMLALLNIRGIAFGKLKSFSLLDAMQTIPTRPSLSPIGTPTATQIGFHVLLPATPKPAHGYPVLLAGHGLGDSRMQGPSLLAFSFAARGYAVVAIDAVGHGFGSQTTYRFGTSAGTVEVPAYGRGVDLDGDGAITESEGCVVVAPTAPVVIRDCVRQTAIDWMSVVKTIRNGIDLDGDGTTDLDATNINYWGQSLGSFYGTLLMAMDPAIQSAVLNVGGGSGTETARTSLAFHPAAQFYLGLRQPMLLNSGTDFNEQYPLRDQGVTTLSVPGAAELQDVFERLEWIESSGEPANFAPMIKWNPSFDASYKRVLFQIAVGDTTVPNPANSMLIRAVDGISATSLYRHDIARAIVPTLPANPHTFFAFLLDPAGAPISIAALTQAAEFVSSGIIAVPDVNSIVKPVYGSNLFETPLTLPENLNFLKP